MPNARRPIWRQPVLRLEANCAELQRIIRQLQIDKRNLASEKLSLLQDRQNRLIILQCVVWRMGTRESEQGSLWVATAELPKSPGHPFYTRLNALLDADNFDRFVEGQCARFYAPVMGRPSLAPGRYFRCCWSATLKGSTRNAGLPGARATRWRCALFCGCRWTSRRRIIRRFLVQTQPPVLKTTKDEQGRTPDRMTRAAPASL